MDREVKTIVQTATEQAENYGVDKELILLLHYSRELRNKNFRRAEKINKAVKLIRSPIKLYKQ